MKRFANSVFALTLVLAATSAAAEMAVSARVFKIDFKKPHAYGNETQMCDDSYFDTLEIWLPAQETSAKALLAQFKSQCGMAIANTSYVATDDDLHFRIVSTDSWDCEVVFKDPAAKDPATAHDYTLSLGDGC